MVMPRGGVAGLSAVMFLINVLGLGPVCLIQYISCTICLTIEKVLLEKYLGDF